MKKTVGPGDVPVVATKGQLSLFSFQETVCVCGHVESRHRKYGCKMVYTVGCKCAGFQHAPEAE